MRSRLRCRCLAAVFPIGSIRMTITAKDFNPPTTGRSRSAFWTNIRNGRIHDRASNLPRINWSFFSKNRASLTHAQNRTLSWWHLPCAQRAPTSNMLKAWETSPLNSLSPNQVQDILTDRLTDYADLTLWSHANGHLYWSMRLEDGDGVCVDAARRVDLRTGVAVHDLMLKSGKMQIKRTLTKFWSGALNLNAVTLYGHLGVGKVIVHAGLSLGGYVWARRGFCPLNEREWRRVKAFVNRRYAIIQSEMSKDDRAELRAILDDDDRMSVHRIARLSSPIRPTLDAKRRGRRNARAGDDTPSSAGFVLLAHSNWIGLLDLDNAAQMKRFRSEANKQISAHNPGT